MVGITFIFDGLCELLTWYPITYSRHSANYQFCIFIINTYNYIICSYLTWFLAHACRTLMGKMNVCIALDEHPIAMSITISTENTLQYNMWISVYQSENTSKYVNFILTEDHFHEDIYIICVSNTSTLSKDIK